MNWKSGSLSPIWISSSLAYSPPAAGEFTITAFPTTIQRGVPFVVECENLSEPSAVTLAGLPIDVESFDTGDGELELVVPGTFDGKHGVGQTLAITVDGVTKQFTTAFNPPEGWSYVDFVDPTNDPDISALYGLLDGDGEPTIVGTGDQAVYRNTAGDENFEVVIDADNTIAINSGGETLQGLSVPVYVITADGRGEQGNLVFSSYSEPPPEPNAVWRAGKPLYYATAGGTPAPLASQTGISYAIYSGTNGTTNGTRLLTGVIATDGDGYLPDIDSDLLGNIGDSVTVVLRTGTMSIVIQGTVIDGNA